MAAASAASTIVEQEQLFEDLVRHLRYKDAVVSRRGCLLASILANHEQADAP